MNYPILSTRITEASMVTLRDRARQVGELFGLDKLESTRFITAVSEIGRNAVQFAGGGTAAFSFKQSDDPAVPQAIIAIITDGGPGIANIAAIWSGRANVRGRVPLGLAGARRMVDALTVQCPKSGGTIVTLEMHLPRGTPRLTHVELNERTKDLISRKPKTPLQELEKQNSEMLDALQELREKQLELKRADERKNDFLAMLAHELRTPLSTLVLNLEILRLNPANLAKCWGPMTRQTEQMRRLVEDLMDVSRISQGKVKLDEAPLEVNQLVTQALEMCSSVLEAKQHAVTLRQLGCEVWIAGDASRLKQVLGNLLHNASRYTPDHGQIDVSISRDATSVHINVTDNGIGISVDMLPQVFDMFVQGNMTESASGLGIGLTLVRRLVEKHGGSVSAASEGPGKGSSFVVSLPLVAA